MADSYWISDGVNQAGPFPREELPQHGLRADSLVWTEGMPDWQRADAVDELRPLLAPASVEAPSWPAPVDEPPLAHAPPSAEVPLAVEQAVIAEPPGMPPPYPGQPIPQTTIAYHAPLLQAPQRQDMAILSLVMGILGFIVPAIPSILAIVFGHIALGRIRRGEESGKGLAITGLALGYAIVGLYVLMFFVVGLMFCLIPQL